MELGSHPPGPPVAGELLHAQVAEAVRQGVQLAKMDWDTGLSDEAAAEVDRLIERKIDKVKLWLAGLVLVNLLPVIGFGVMFGSFTGRIESKLETIAEKAPARETTLRLDKLERDVERLESYHRRGGE